MTEEFLEGYYPDPWKLNKEQAKQKQQEGKKVDYAKDVADTITQQQFESNMNTLFSALEACNLKGFNPKS